MTEYKNRDQVLRAIGFDSYQAYLDSSMWKVIRSRVMYRDGGRCLVCGERAFMVHHKDYSKSTLLGECIDSLSSVCGQCHAILEFNESGSKNSLNEANSKLDLYRQSKRPEKDGYVVLNAKMIKRLRTSNGFTKACLAALGIQWPAKKGWIATLIGKRMSAADYEKACGAKFQTVKNVRFRKVCQSCGQSPKKNSQLCRTCLKKQRLMSNSKPQVEATKPPLECGVLKTPA